MNSAAQDHCLPGLTLSKTGKVRSIYDVSPSELLLIASDRISAFDVVLPTPIPGKGAVLTQISNFWFTKLNHICPNHLILKDFDTFPDSLKKYRDTLEFRSVIVKKAQMLPFEFIVRGYISGSLWKAYCQHESIADITLSDGLLESSQLPNPIFTPTTKAETGHDEPVSETFVRKTLGAKLAGEVREIALELYEEASAYARNCGIIIADTKIEFGVCDNKVIVCDELLTPDSSRFWPLSTYAPGKSQESFDKQYVRDFLDTLTWDKKPPGPELPEDVVVRTVSKYNEAFTRLTGYDLPFSRIA